MSEELCFALRDMKGIRKGILFNALNETHILQENVNMKTIIDLDNVIDTAEVVSEQLSLDEKVENQDEVVLDSEVMKSSSNVLREGTNSLTKNINCYDANEYTEFIMEYIRRSADIPTEDEGIPWEALEFEIIPIFKKTPFFSSLAGALVPLPKKPMEQKVRTQEKKVPQSQVKKPEKIDKVVKEKEAEEASLAVQKIRKLIANYFKKTQSSLDYFRLVLHPSDFGKTIENILHVAFLVRDGYINLFTGENGTLEVLAVSKEVITQAKSSGKKKCIQNIIPLNFHNWQILTNYYNIEEPMINF